MSETATICSLYIHLNWVRDAVLVLLDGSESSREYRSIWHSLQMNGMRVLMTVIDQLVRELDSDEVHKRKAHPLKRRTYQNAGPDHLWHYDGHHKFKPYGFPVHSCIDCWSRLPISYLWHLPRIYQANSIILYGSSWRVKGCPIDLIILLVQKTELWLGYTHSFEMNQTAMALALESDNRRMVVISL